MDQRASQVQRAPLDVVESFSGPFEFLSNFYQHPFSWQGRVAQTAEHHYNAAKTNDLSEKARVYDQETPGRAKREGQKVTLREGWDDHLKGDCMASIIEAKFAPGTELAQRLTQTGNALLIEGNRWHDQYWGQCGCEKHYHWPGANMLGRILMARRSALRNTPTPFARIGVTGHRPQFLSAAENDWVREQLPALMSSLKKEYGAQVAISGMALGADTVWAQAALDQGLRLWGYVPFLGQGARWPLEDQRTYEALLSEADRVVTLGKTHDLRWFRARNDLIVRDSDVLVAVHKEGKTKGGTVAAIRKARQCNARLIRVNVTRREIVAVTKEGEIPWRF